MRSSRQVLMRFLSIAAVVLGSPAVIAAAMQPGLWELALTVTVDGRMQTLPSGRECIAQKDIDEGNRTLPRPEGSCELSNVDRTADRAAYDLTCRQSAMTTQGRAEILFAGDRYDGKVLMTVNDQKAGAGLPIAMTINARRIGECAK
jgi:hypothetical protein